MPSINLSQLMIVWLKYLSYDFHSKWRLLWKWLTEPIGACTYLDEFCHFEFNNQIRLQALWNRLIVSHVFAPFRCEFCENGSFCLPQMKTTVNVKYNKTWKLVHSCRQRAYVYCWTDCRWQSKQYVRMHM